VDARNLPRLAAALQGAGVQPVSYELLGSQLEDQHFIDIAASASLNMQCQRCLGEVCCEVEVDARLLLVRKGDPMPDEDLEIDDFDPVYAGHDFDVLSAVEEELLLALPLAPTHDNCSVPAAKENGDDRSPFALLKGFKAQS
jgi:uncharacterized protein